MYKYILAITIAISTSLSSKADENLTWYSNLDTAITLSNESGKPVFGFFTGSDWCGWCMKLQRDVFAKTAFIEWAQANVILLEIDFPRTKVLPDALRKQNQELQVAFGVQGYPTIHFFTGTKDAAKGTFALTSWGQCGYPGGAEKGKEEVKFLETANGILAKNPNKKNTAE